MRRYYLLWSIAVFGIFGTIYGAYLISYHFNYGNGLNTAALILLIAGAMSLLTFLFTYIPIYLKNKKKKEEPIPIKEETMEEEETLVEEPVKKQPVEEPVVEEAPTDEEPEEDEEYDSEPGRSSYSYSIYDSPSSTVYIKQLGRGPLLRVDGYRIFDMRTNTYYRIEGNMVKQEGCGPLYEIRGNQIKNAFGGYLYEISGSNINKIYGGFYASISGNYITLYDLSVKYEMSDTLNKTQLLAVAVLLFGKY